MLSEASVFLSSFHFLTAFFRDENVHREWIIIDSLSKKETKKEDPSIHLYRHAHIQRHMYIYIYIERHVYAYLLMPMPWWWISRSLYRSVSSPVAHV